MTLAVAIPFAANRDYIDKTFWSASYQLLIRFGYLNPAPTIISYG